MAYTTSTLADLQALMIQRWDQVVFWTAEEARLAINEALRDWNLLTGRWRRRVTLDAVACVPDLPLPGTLTYAMRVTTFDGWPLIPSSLSDLDLGQPAWRNQTVETPGVARRPTVWAPLSLTAIAIWPSYRRPQLGALHVDGVMATPILTAPADFIDLGEETVDIITDMALHVAALKEAGDRWRATRPYFEAFLRAAAEENSLLKTHQAYRRWAGLDQRRQWQPTKDAPNQLTSVAQQFSRHDQEER
jgi:hypothetical protein